MNNDERHQTYPNLIEALLNCTSGEEPTILRANQNLIDAGLVQTMLDCAVNLVKTNNINASERLIKIVVDLLITLRNPNFGSQEFSQAIESYEQVKAFCQQRSYLQMEVMLLYYIRFFYSYTNEYAKSIESSKRLLVIMQNFRKQSLEAETLFHLGNDYQKLGNLDEARNHYHQGLAIANQIDTDAAKKLRVDILNALGLSYNYPQWELAKAIEICKNSLHIAKEIGYRHGEAIALTCIGKAHYWFPGEQRNFPEAINCYEQAKTIFQETGNLQGEYEALYVLQDSYNYTSQYAQAINCNQRLLTIAQSIGHHLLEARVLLDLGRSYNALGFLKKEEAKNYYEQSLAIAEQIHSKDAQSLQVRSLQGLGGYYRVNGNLTEAERLYQESLRTAENIGAEQWQANASQALAEIYYYQGKLDRAWEYNERSLTLKKRLQDQIGKGNSVGFRGNIYLVIGEYTKALESFEQSLQIMEEIKNVSGKASTLTDMGVAYLSLNQIEEAESKLQQGIELWESVRGRLGDRDDFQVSIFEQQARTYKLLLDVLIDQEKPLLALEISERSRARAFVDLLSRKLNGQLSQTTITSPRIEEIRRIAKQHNATLVEYSVNRSKLYIWVIKPDGEIIFKQVDLESFDKLHNLVTNSLKAIGVRGRATVEIVHSPSIDEKQCLKQLYNLLVKPIADLLPSDPNAEVIFIPYQELFLVPFAALLTEQEEYLIEKHTVLTAPSVQVLDLTHQKLKQSSSQNYQVPKSFNILIVGNPTMPSVSFTKGKPAEQLSSLPGAEIEAREIAKLFNTQAFIGAEATETIIKSELLNADIIHLATHGLLDYGQIQGQIRQDLPGALALAPEEGREDGLLTSGEIFDLELNASLVVLSACDTGRGKITSDGILGLSRSFISAGTPSIIVSLWAVPDAPTADLMEKFYNQLKLNPNKAQALRQAMLKTMQQHPHPKDWAAFTLIGETQGTVLN